MIELFKTTRRLSKSSNSSIYRLFKQGFMIMLKITFVCLMLSFQQIAAQKDSSKHKPSLSGVVILMSNGISQIPAYSLGRPAVSAFFNFTLKRFSYEPDINYGLDGRPWGMGNTFMYLVIDKEKLKLKSGLALGLAFSYPEVLQNGRMVKINKSERYLIAKFIPSYIFSEKTSVNLIYWNAHNLEAESIKLINFLSVALSISNISASSRVYCSVSPQIFYLNVDGDDGVFFSPVATIGIKNFPLYLSSQVNTTLFTNMSPDPGFKWNIALNYNFSLTR